MFALPCLTTAYVYRRIVASPAASIHICDISQEIPSCRSSTPRFAVEWGNPQIQMVRSKANGAA